MPGEGAPPSALRSHFLVAVRDRKGGTWRESVSRVLLTCPCCPPCCRPPGTAAQCCPKPCLPASTCCSRTGGWRHGWFTGRLLASRRMVLVLRGAVTSCCRRRPFPQTCFLAKLCLLYPLRIHPVQAVGQRTTARLLPGAALNLLSGCGHGPRRRGHRGAPTFVPAYLWLP